MTPLKGAAPPSSPPEAAASQTPSPKPPPPPRLRVTKGAPWRIDPGRRAKWSAPAFLAANAVDIRQIGDPVLHAPAKKPKLSRADLEGLVGRMFASMVIARGIGIAAPQIGFPLRIAIMYVDRLRSREDLHQVEPEEEEPVSA